MPVPDSNQATWIIRPYPWTPETVSGSWRLSFIGLETGTTTNGATIPTPRHGACCTTTTAASWICAATVWTRAGVIDKLAYLDSIWCCGTPLYREEDNLLTDALCDILASVLLVLSSGWRQALPCP